MAIRKEIVHIVGTHHGDLHDFDKLFHWSLCVICFVLSNSSVSSFENTEMTSYVLYYHL